MMITVGIGSWHYAVTGGMTHETLRSAAAISACMYAARARGEIAHGFQPMHRTGVTPDDAT